MHIHNTKYYILPYIYVVHTTHNTSSPIAKSGDKYQVRQCTCLQHTMIQHPKTQWSPFKITFGKHTPPNYCSSDTCTQLFVLGHHVR